MTDGPDTTRFALPEFTRSLRGFASVQALGTKSHDLVFGPLLAARRSAARVGAPEGRAAAFDAGRLRRSLMEAIAALAADRAAGDASLRRALEARLEERAGSAFAALDALATAALALKSAAPEARPPAWAAWCDAVQDLFDAADTFWLAIGEVEPPPGSGARRFAPLLIAALGLSLHASALPAQHVTVRVQGLPDSLIAKGFDVVGAEAGSALVVVSPRDQSRLDRLGLRWTPLPARAAIGASAQATTTVYRSFDDPVRGIKAWVDSLAAANPMVTVDTIGYSYEHRPLLVLKIGPKGDSPQRPNVLFMATYHAREWAATEMARRLATWLAAPPGTDARRDSLVQSRDIWIMPVANPDGYQYTFSDDRLWRKTRSPQAGGAVGADMNRNHSSHWGLDNQGSSSDPSSDIYRGPSPASEAETRAIEAFHVAHPPVVSLSYHTYAGLLLYSPSAVYGDLPADRPVYQTIAGTNLRSAVTDRLPGSVRPAYASGPAWTLYSTNGEYTDFASTLHGTVAFTAEITSGYGTSGYYGFEFPDDETLLAQLFQDNLPFALDLLDAASAPGAFVSPTTGLKSDQFVLESAAPDIRMTVPAAAAPTASLAAGSRVTFRIDSAAGGRYTRRLVSATVGRPPTFTVTAAGATASFRTLAISGAETADIAWTASGFRRDTLFARAGASSWYGTQGTLVSPPIGVPADADTVSIVFWTMYYGNGFLPTPYGTVDVSTDAGQSWTPMMVERGSAPLWYTDGVTVGGVHGKSLIVRFAAVGMDWRLDEIAVVAHGAVTAGPAAKGPKLRPSENPVRSGAVRFSWPFGDVTGDLIAYDFAGRELWRRHVADGAPQTWDVASLGVGNGVYLIVARAGTQIARLKLFVARRSP